MKRAAKTDFVGYALRVTPTAPDEQQGRLAFVDGDTDNLRTGNFLDARPARSSGGKGRRALAESRDRKTPAVSHRRFNAMGECWPKQSRSHQGHLSSYGCELPSSRRPAPFLQSGMTATVEIQYRARTG